MLNDYIVKAYLSGYAFTFKGDVSMKRLLCVLFALLVLIILPSCDSNQEAETTTESTTETTTEETINYYDEFETETAYYNWDENAQEDETTFSTNESQTQVATTSAHKSEETTKSTVVTYYSESPDNKYIKYIARRYNADPFTLRALIRKKTDVGGATVLQFTGETDSNGELIMSEDTLLYVYDIDTNGNVKKATGTPNGNEGYSTFASQTAFKLTKKYILPNLETVKKERTYEDYYND